MKSRAYVQTTRAEAAEATRIRILDAVVEQVLTSGSTAFSLAEIAAAADVSVQTILRRFGSRDALYDSAIDHGIRRMLTEREAPEGDIEGAIHVIVGHYETSGLAVLTMLSNERMDPRFAEFTAMGRVEHRAWISRLFVRWLDDPRPDLVEETTDLLVVATDVYTWKILRHDRGLSRDKTEERMRHLTYSILSGRSLAPDKE